MRESCNPERDAEIVREMLSGVSAGMISKKYGISATRVSQIVAKGMRIKTHRFNLNERRKADTHRLTWVQVVRLLMPNIEAIRAIAKEENS